MRCRRPPALPTLRVNSWLVRGKVIAGADDPRLPRSAGCPAAVTSVAGEGHRRGTGHGEPTREPRRPASPGLVDHARTPEPGWDLDHPRLIEVAHRWACGRLLAPPAPPRPL